VKDLKFMVKVGVWLLNVAKVSIEEAKEFNLHTAHLKKIG